MGEPRRVGLCEPVDKGKAQRGNTQVDGKCIGHGKAEKGNMGDVMNCIVPNFFWLLGAEFGCANGMWRRGKGKIKWHVRFYMLCSIVVIVNEIVQSKTDNKIMDLFLGSYFCRIPLLLSVPCH